VSNKKILLRFTWCSIWKCSGEFSSFLTQAKKGSTQANKRKESMLHKQRKEMQRQKKVATQFPGE
jgi:hypothetical protein